MKRIYIDMDGVLADFYGAFRQKKSQDKTIEYPQSKTGFFESLDPIKNAIDAYNHLDKHFDVWVLTAPSVLNPLCYTEKRLWIEKHLGIDRCHKLIIAPDKSLLKGDYLIDDTITKGQTEFEGELIHFGQEKFKDWYSIIEFFDSLILNGSH